MPIFSYHNPDPPCDEIFRACFGCEHSPAQSYYNSPRNSYLFGYDSYGNYIDRQTGETYESTQQSRRVVCRGGGRCNLRVDKAAQRRDLKYGKALNFANQEQYLSNEDLDLIGY